MLAWWTTGVALCICSKLGCWEQRDQWQAYTASHQPTKAAA